MQIRQRVQGQPRFRAQHAPPGLGRRHPCGDPVARALRIDDFKSRMPVKCPPLPKRDTLPGQGMEAVMHRDLRAGAQCGVSPDILEMIRAGALVSVSTSGGKDSQAMTILLSRIVPRDQLVAVHAPLAGVEWPGTIEHIRATIPDGMPLILAHVTSGKTLLDSIEERGRFPSPAVRWCTSSTKRGPIERELRRYLKAHPRFGGRIVNAMGMRSEESPARARKPTWRLNERNSRAGRTWCDWLPIHDLTEGQVLDVIRAAGQAPHPAYAMGMSRLSCVFCIMASRADFRTAARLQPRLYADYVALERRIGHTLSPSGVPLPELTGIPVTADAARRSRRRRTRSP